MKYNIYFLVCPLTQDVRYIGKTSQTLEIRLATHYCNKEDSPIGIWVRGLREDGLKPIIKLIAVYVEDRYAKEAERDLIRRYASEGYDLLNRQYHPDYVLYKRKHIKREEFIRLL